MKRVLLVALFALLAVAMATAQNYIPTTDVLGAHNNGGRGCAGCHAPHSGARGNGGTIAGGTGDPVSLGGNEGDYHLWGQDVSLITQETLQVGGGYGNGGAGYTVRTDDLMAEAGCLYHTSWIIDDQPWPINVRGGQKFIYVPYTGQTNDAGMLAWNREADYFQQMIKDQFDTLYREGAESGRVMCLSLHPHNIGRPNAAKHLDEALKYILGHDGVWNTTADDIAEYYLANYYDQVTAWIADRKRRSAA